MGLDVTAYSKVKRLRDHDGGDYDDGEVILFNAPEFVQRAADLPGGLYSYDEALDVFSRSYGAYNRWREQLAVLAGYAKHETERDPCHFHSRTAWEADGGPFWELINFTDCDGVLGTATCQKLLRDFDAFADRAKSVADEWFRHVYESFHEAFKLAADGGAIRFH